MRGIGNAAVYEDVLPSPELGERDVAQTREVRSTDVSKLSFPIQMVIAIVVSAVSASATIWAVQSGNAQAQSAIQSDIRDILTRMEGQAKLADSNQRLLDSQQSSMKDSMDALQRQVQLLQLQYAEISKQIAQQR